MTSNNDDQYELFEEIDWTTVELKWYGEKPPHAHIDQRVREDCAVNLTGLAAVDQLIFHNIPLEDDWDKHLVTVWGVEGDLNVLHCEYSPSPKWVTLDPDKDDNDNLS